MVLTELWESNKLTVGFTGFVDPVNGLLDRLLEIKPARLGGDGCSLVFLNYGNHVGDLCVYVVSDVEDVEDVEGDDEMVNWDISRKFRFFIGFLIQLDPSVS